MRIGILTFHRAHNYGAVLQCYALQSYLSSKGHDVSVIDYFPTRFYEFYNWFHPELLKVRNPFEFIRRVRLLIAKRKRYKSFEKFINKSLLLTSIESTQLNPYDFIIVGSDQVWNYDAGFDPFYWGAIKLPVQTKVVSYAASMQDNIDESMAPVIKEMLKNFDAISVRESRLRDSLVELTGNESIEHVIDPTLLLSSKDWSDFASQRRINNPYLLLYLVQYKPEVERVAIRIAKERNLELIYITPDVDGKTTPSVKNTSPEDFVSLFKYADFVVSASFHGTVFCLQFKKPFLSFKMGIGRDSRVASLLEPLGLIDHFTDEYDPSFNYDCNYDEENFMKMKLTSFSYIQKVTSTESDL